MRREIRLFDELEKFAKGHWLTNALALTFGYDGDAAYANGMRVSFASGCRRS
jgi:hypothetical protein